MSNKKDSSQVSQTPKQVESVLENVNATTGEVTTVENIRLTPTLVPLNKLARLLSQARSLADRKTSISITPKYLEFESKGTKMRGIFMQFKKIKIESKQYKKLADVPESKKSTFFEEDDTLKSWLECVMFTSETGEMYIMGGITFVSPFKEQQIEYGTEFEVTYAGIKGKTKVFEVKLLESPDIEIADAEELN